ARTRPGTRSATTPATEPARTPAASSTASSTAGRRAVRHAGSSPRTSSAASAPSIWAAARPTARRRRADMAGTGREAGTHIRDCGIPALARPHPCEPRWYQEYTTTDGRCFVADRVPRCQPAGPQPPAAAERARHAGELDRAAGRAWRQGDLGLAARLIADARAL